MKTSISATSVAANTTGFASNVTGATWTLTATTSGDSLAHLVTIHNDSATDHSAKTATIVGTDGDGNVQTETLNLPAGTATVTSTKYFGSVISVTPSATIGADTMDIGWAAGSVSGWKYFKENPGQFAVGFGCLVASGSPNYSVQHQYGDGTAFTHSVVTGKTANADGSYLVPITAMRLMFTAAGGVNLTAIQYGA